MQVSDPGSDRVTHDLGDEGLPVLGGGSAQPGFAGAPSQIGELVVEVELTQAKQARHLVEAVSPENIVAAAAPDGPGIDPQLAAVMQHYSLLAVHPAFSRIGAMPASVSGSAPPNSRPGAEGVSGLPSTDSIIRLHFPAGTPEAEVLSALRSNESVAKAVRVPEAAPPSAVLAPGPGALDPFVGDVDLKTDPATGLETQWYLHRLHIPAAWSVSRGANTVLIDIDWGCRTSHRELRAGIEYAYNAFDGGSDVTRGTYVDHGTAVTSIAAARADGIGMEGCAPEAKIWIIQADSGPGLERSPTSNHWADALQHVASLDSSGRPKVIILEVQTGSPYLGNYEQLPAVHLAVRNAIAAGCIVCVAAGNGNRRAHFTDDGASFEPTGSILVGATTFDHVGNPRASFSNYGPSVVVCAPGDPDHDLSCTANSDDSYRNRFGGTSGATPKVAGVVALMVAANPALTHQDVREILISTGHEKVGDPGKPIGTFVDADAAVRAAAMRRGGGAPVLNIVPIAAGVAVQPQDNSTTGVTLTPDQAWQLAAKAVQAVAQVTPGKEGAITVSKGADGTQLLASRRALLEALDKAANHLVSSIKQVSAQDFLVTTAADVDQACRAAVVRDRLAAQTRRLRGMAGSATGQAAAPFVLTLAAVAQVVPAALAAIAQAGKLLRTDRSMSLFVAGDESLRILCRMLEAKSTKHAIRRLDNGPALHAEAIDLLRRLEALEILIGRVQQSVVPAAAPALVQLEVDSARKLLIELNPDDNSVAFWNQVLGEVNCMQMARCGRIDLHVEGQAIQTIEKRALLGDRIQRSGTVLLDYRITDVNGALVKTGAEIFESS